MRLFNKRKRHYHIVKYKGVGNKVILHKEDGSIKINPRFLADVRVKFEGNNSTLDIYQPYNLPSSRIALRNNNHFVIKKISGHGFNIIGGEDVELFIDEGTTLQNTKIFLNDEKGVSVKIGKDCMFSYDIMLWASDTHKIIDSNDEVLNKSKFGIEIGDHVWCGTRCTILKDAKISNNSVIGAASVVTRRFEDENVIIAGNPARIIKENISWKREGLDVV